MPPIPREHRSTFSPAAAQTRAGQVAAFALVDLVLRVHRNVRIEAPDTLVVCAGRTGSLRAALLETAGRIDPFPSTTKACHEGELIV